MHVIECYLFITGRADGAACYKSDYQYYRLNSKTR